MNFARRLWRTVKLSLSLYGMIALCSCVPAEQGLRDIATAANEAATAITAGRACSLNACVRPGATEDEIRACVAVVVKQFEGVERLYDVLRRVHCTLDQNAEGCASSEAPASELPRPEVTP